MVPAENVAWLADQASRLQPPSPALREAHLAPGPLTLWKPSPVLEPLDGLSELKRRKPNMRATRAEETAKALLTVARQNPLPFSEVDNLLHNILR